MRSIPSILAQAHTLKHVKRLAHRKPSEIVNPIPAVEYRQIRKSSIKLPKDVQWENFRYRNLRFYSLAANGSK